MGMTEALSTATAEISTTERGGFGGTDDDGSFACVCLCARAGGRSSVEIDNERRVAMLSRALYRTGFREESNVTISIGSTSSCSSCCSSSSSWFSHSSSHGCWHPNSSVVMSCGGVSTPHSLGATFTAETCDCRSVVVVVVVAVVAVRAGGVVGVVGVIVESFCTFRCALRNFRIVS